MIFAHNIYLFLFARIFMLSLPVVVLFLLEHRHHMFFFGLFLLFMLVLIYAHNFRLVEGVFLFQLKFVNFYGA